MSSIIYLSIHEFVSPSTADLKPGWTATGPLGPEGRRGDGGQLRHLRGPPVRSRDRKLHLLCSGQPVRVQKVSVHQQNSLMKMRKKNLIFAAGIL